LSRPLAQASLATGAAGSGRFYSPQLDGLRFIAAFAVFIHHAPAVPVLSAIKPYGWAGVDMFLSISAFLITRLILLEHERTGSFSMRSFYIRRALRIWPLYLTYATAVCVLTLLAGMLDARTVAAWWLSHVSFTNNVMTAVKGYSPVLFSAHLWTISLEEQAYLLMPLLLSAFIVGGLRDRAAILFCLGGIAVLLVARTGLTMARIPHPFIWVLPLRSDAFLLGALAAILTRDGRQVAAPWLAVTGLILIGTLPFFPPVDQVGAYQVFGYTVLAAGCTAIVLASQHSDIARRILGCGPMRYLGKISYGFYVYHVAAIVLAARLLKGAGLQSASMSFGLGLLLTVVVAAASYRILERPFLLLKDRYARVLSRPA
jgi:peptidoglycan/LPS O-acetylase OafA/YrhL